MKKDKIETAYKLLSEINELEKVNSESDTDSIFMYPSPINKSKNTDKGISISFGGLYRPDEQIKIPKRHKHRIINAIRSILDDVNKEMEEL